MGDGPGVVAVQAERVDPLLDEANDLGLDLDGIMEEGVRLVAGDEPAVGPIATVGESFREIPDPPTGGLGVQEAPGLAQDRQLQAGRRVEDAPGDLRLALGLVVEGAVRLEEAEGQADLGGESSSSRTWSRIRRSTSAAVADRSRRPNPSRSA